MKEVLTIRIPAQSSDLRAFYFPDENPLSWEPVNTMFFDFMTANLRKLGVKQNLRDLDFGELIRNS